MTLEKQTNATPEVVTVRFLVPQEDGAATAELVGEFTGWSPVRMEARSDGGHEAVIDLAGGAAYRFRYLLDGERWVNDWAADDYVPNDYGSEDSVVDLTTATTKTATKSKPKAAPRKRAPRKKTGPAKG